MIVQGHATTSYQPQPLHYSTTYFWRVVARDTEGEQSSSPVWQFRTQPQPQFPPVVNNLGPIDGTIDVSVEVVLSWDASDPNGDALSYAVSLDTATVPSLVISDLSESSYQTAGLEYSTKYYWLVTADDGNGNVTSSPTLSFTTEPPPNAPPDVHSPWPTFREVGIEAVLLLSWESEDPESDPLTWNVYFGTEPDPPLVAENWNMLRYRIGVLMPLTTYYWKISVSDDHGNTTTSPRWSFTTGETAICPLTVGNSWIWEYTYEYVDPPQTIVQQAKLEITGKSVFSWDGRDYVGYHWNWHTWPGNVPDEYFHLMSNESDGLTVVGVGSNNHDTVYVFESLMIKYPVAMTDTWVYEQPGGYSERWVCISTDFALETKMGLIQCIRYAVTPIYNNSYGSDALPNGPLGEVVSKCRRASGRDLSVSDLSATYYVYYSPEVGYISIHDPAEFYNGNVISFNLE